MQRTLDAISACTRTLAGTTDVVPDFSSGGVASVGAFRALGDRAALDRRFQDSSIQDRYRPKDSKARALFDALSAARLDTLGVRWLVGMAANLLEYPGPGPAGVRWCAFGAFSDQPVPPARDEAARHASRQLSSPLLASLRALGDLVDDHQRFAAAAAEWAIAASTEPVEDGIEVSGIRVQAPPRQRGVADVRRGRFALPAARRRTASPGVDGESGSHHAPDRHDPVAAIIGYRAYTTAFDRVVNASALATRAEILALRRQLDVDFATVRTTVAKVAKRLMRALMARQAREWRFDLEDGLLDPARLSVFVASRGAARPFRQEFDSPFPSTVVTLLIDHSGSMRGRPMRIAALTVEIVARVLERCGLRCEVLGFTTGEWDGGEPARQWAANGYPEAPGRLNALEHIVIKGADVPWRRARASLGLLLHEEMLKENIDGEAVVWAHGRLRVRPERRRVLIVISDGMPMDEATCAANGFDYLDGHLAAVVEDIERRSTVRIAAIGIGHDVSGVYRHATRIARVDDLGAALANRLLSLLAP